MVQTFKKILICLSFGFFTNVESYEILSKPKFIEFEVKVQKVFNSNVKLNLTNQKNKQFKTLLNSFLSTPPNFAGKYVIASWGCGSSCQRHAIINKNSGEVYWPKEIEASFNLSACDINTLEFQSNSTLLVLNEHHPEMGITKIFYNWNGLKLRKIYTQSINEELCVMD